VVLAGVEARVEQRGVAIQLTAAGADRPMPKERLVPIGDYQLLAAGLPGQAVLTVFAKDARAYRPPRHYPYRARWHLTVTLTPAPVPRVQRMLAPDGTEVEATEAGTVAVPVGGRSVSLRVFRIPGGGGEESELEIFFRDETNRSGTYPAGRFVALVPIESGRYRLDFNRARNPFCAYSSVYPCPAPWRGNILPAAVEAGERYDGGGLSKPPI
jgi:hypothetical protein